MSMTAVLWNARRHDGLPTCFASNAMKSTTTTTNSGKKAVGHKKIDKYGDVCSVQFDLSLPRRREAASTTR
jgi:hypothetical protein